MTPTLTEIRQACQLTPRQMADSLGIRLLSNYTRLESGRREPTDQLMAAARVILWVYRDGRLPALMACLPLRN